VVPTVPLNSIFKGALVADESNGDDILSVTALSSTVEVITGGV